MKKCMSTSTTPRQERCMSMCITRQLKRHTPISITRHSEKSIIIRMCTILLTGNTICALHQKQCIILTLNTHQFNNITAMCIILLLKICTTTVLLTIQKLETFMTMINTTATCIILLQEMSIAIAVIIHLQELPIFIESLTSSRRLCKCSTLSHITEDMQKSTSMLQVLITLTRMITID